MTQDKPTATQAVLITVSGKDAPGITAELTKVLAHGGATILDLGQAQSPRPRGRDDFGPRPGRHPRMALAFDPL